MDQNGFFISNWCGIPHKFIRHADGTLAVDRIREARESGINLLAAYDYGHETNCAFLTACEEVGMKVMLSDHRLDQAIGDSQHRRELLAAVVRDYAHYPALFGYHVMDEPIGSYFEALGQIRSILAELDPAHEAYINLFPNYAEIKALGFDTYRDYLTDFVDTVHPEILSYDHYHFIKEQIPAEPSASGEESDKERRIREDACRKVERPGFFDNIEDALAVSEATGTPFMIIILVVEHGPYRNLTEAEIRWEVFNSLCYGIKRLTYFTYWTPGVDTAEGDDFWHWQNGMINKDGTRNVHYDQIRRINRELQAMGDILMPYRVRRVFHFGIEPDKKVSYWPGGYGYVTAMSAQKVTAGFYEGGYILLANKDYEAPQDVTLTAEPHRHIWLYDKATNIWTSHPENTCTLTLAPGDGTLIRID